MLVIAHRGANREALENSWDALEKAVESSDRIEIDVQLSRDGHVYILHDDSLLRTAGKPSLINFLTASELSQIKLLNGEAIPRLDELLARFLPRIEVNIEIKEDNLALAQHTAALVKQSPHRDRVIFSSFHPIPLDYLRDACPAARRAFLVSPYTLKFMPGGFLAPQLYMQRFETTIIHPHTGMICASFMDQANARGWIVYPYASLEDEDVDREQTWTKLRSLGVAGLCTNYPRELKHWLRTQE